MYLNAPVVQNKNQTSHSTQDPELGLGMALSLAT